MRRGNLQLIRSASDTGRGRASACDPKAQRHGTRGSGQPLDKRAPLESNQIRCGAMLRPVRSALALVPAMTDFDCRTRMAGMRPFVLSAELLRHTPHTDGGRLPPPPDLQSVEPSDCSPLEGDCRPPRRQTASRTREGPVFFFETEAAVAQFGLDEEQRRRLGAAL
jgi:hypothetical protein